MKLHPLLTFEREEVYIKLRKNDFDYDNVVVHLSGQIYHISGYNLLFISQTGLKCCDDVGLGGTAIKGIDIDELNHYVLKVIGVDLV